MFFLVFAARQGHNPYGVYGDAMTGTQGSQPHLRICCYATIKIQGG